jgi:hypothetical protein
MTALDEPYAAHARTVVVADIETEELLCLGGVTQDSSDCAYLGGRS